MLDFDGLSDAVLAVPEIGPISDAWLAKEGIDCDAVERLALTVNYAGMQRILAGNGTTSNLFKQAFIIGFVTGWIAHRDKEQHK